MRRWSGIWIVLLAGTLALVISFFHRTASVESLTRFAQVLAFILAAMTVLWVHEIGHAIGARLAGLKVVGLYLWPYYVRMGVDRKVNILSIAEWCNGGSFRLRGREGARTKLLISLFAGWIASILLIAASRLAMPDLPLLGGSRAGNPNETFTIGAILVRSYLTQVAVLGACHLVLEIMPLREFSTFWDGAFVSDLLKGGETERRAVAQFLMSTEESERRPRDWNRELIDQAREEATSMERLNWIWWNYQHKLDLGDLEACREWVDLGIQTWQSKPALDANMLRAERIYMAHRLNQESFAYREEFDELHYSTNWWYSWHRAQVVVFLREGNVREALYHATGDRRGLNGHEANPLYALEADLWDQLVDECVAASAKETAVASNA